jgi:hypothetical protein
MIYIEKGTVNQIILTLTEVSTLPTPYYLFVFQNEMDLLCAPITFFKGQYTYQIYESTITPPTIANSTGLVIEEGRMVVNGPIVSSIYE